MRHWKHIIGFAIAGASVSTHAPAQLSECRIDIRSMDMIELETEIRSRAFADINADGLPDFIERDFANDVILWRAGRGDGSFGDPTPIPNPQGLLIGDVADLDGDGDNDLVLFRQSNGYVQLVMNHGELGYVVEAGFSVPDISFNHEVWDVDRDGDLDVLIKTRYKSVVVLHNEADEGIWTQTTQDFVSVGSFRFEFEDMNSDGAVDLMMTRNGSGGYVEKLVAFNDGGGIFLPPVSVRRGPLNMSHLVIDANGDDTLDLVVISDAFTVYLGSPSGAFVESQSFPWSGGVARFGLADMDLDGDEDFYFQDDLSNGSERFVICLSDGDGRFEAVDAFPDGFEFEGYFYVKGAENFDGENGVDLLFDSFSGVRILRCPDEGWGHGDATLYEFPLDMGLMVGTGLGMGYLEDRTGDGLKDIVGYSTAYETYYVIPTVKDWFFRRRVIHRPESGQYSIYDAFVDVDLEKGPDLLIWNFEAEQLELRANNGMGEFEFPGRILEGIPKGNEYIWGDLNQDEHLDLVVRSSNSQRSTFYKVHGGENGYEQVGDPLTIEGSVREVVLEDVTGSPADDLIVLGDLEIGSEEFAGGVWENDDTGGRWSEWATFASNTIYASSISQAGVMRLDAGGALGLVVETPNRMYVFESLTAGHHTSSNQILYSSIAGRWDFCIVDHDGDGVDTLVVTDANNDEVNFYVHNETQGMQRIRSIGMDQFYNRITPITAPDGGYGGGFILNSDPRVAVVEYDALGNFRVSEDFQFRDNPAFVTAVGLGTEVEYVHKSSIHILDLDRDGDLDIVRRDIHTNDLWINPNRCTDPCRPDLNFDRVVDQADLHVFVDLWLSADSEADFNGDGILDIGDIGTFITAFLAGC